MKEIIDYFNNIKDQEIKEELNRIDNFSDIELVEYLQNCLLSYSTGGNCYDEIYKYLRLKVLQKPFKDKLPKFIITCRDLGQFWSFIKAKFSTYEERRRYIWDSFSELLYFIEQNELECNLLDEIKFDEPYIHQEWQKALKRKKEDPEGAITISRTLLESVIKNILDEENITYSSKDDLLRLYRKISKLLNLAPENHKEDVFKQILGGMSAIINGIASVRNKLGDAHGQGKKRVRPKERHSELVVNLAGTMAIFLYKTYKEKKAQK